MSFPLADYKKHPRPWHNTAAGPKGRNREAPDRGRGLATGFVCQAPEKRFFRAAENAGSIPSSGEAVEGSACEAMGLSVLVLGNCNGGLAKVNGE